jgi:hypothetical protein
MAPKTIAAGATIFLQAESDGIATGDQGTVTYSSQAGDFVINFNNPNVGSNSYSDSSPPGYSITQDGGSGDNAKVTFTP